MTRFAVLLILLLIAGCLPQREPGSPLFVPASPLSVTRSPGGIVLADMDHDGHLDLITAHWQDQIVEVRYGDGELAFTQGPSGPISLSYPPGGIAVGDVNNDSLLDLGISNHDSYNVDVLLGQQDRTFITAPGSPVIASEGGHPHTHGFALVDVSKDGNLDMLTGNNADNNLAVLMGDGQGGFLRVDGSPFAVGPSPYPFGFGDIDGEGNLDVVVPSSGTGPGVSPSHTVTVLRGDGKGHFQEALGSPLTVAPSPYFVALGALSMGTGLSIVASHDDSNLLSILLNDGKGNFTNASDSPYHLPARAFTVVVVDVNRDNTMDIVAAMSDGVTVLLGNEGGFTVAPGSPFPAGPGAWDLAVGDLNEDGKLDMATSNLESDTVTILLGR
jgi:FG-GAP-like repeat